MRLQQVAARIGLIDDQGGHLIADRFMPKGIRENLVPQNKNLNTSAWKTMENEWAAWTDEGMEVRVMIDVVRSDTVRPDEIIVSYEVHDPATPGSDPVHEVTDEIFLNKPGKVFKRISRKEIRLMLEGVK